MDVAAARRDDETTQERPLPRPPRVGDVVADKYRLVRELGRGGMGRIFAADHLLLDTTVALKFMHPHLTRDRISVTRFSREARAAAALKSEHAARIIDVDQLRTGELYIVMEYLEGKSLDALVERGRGLPIADAVSYIVQACEALAEAHAANIVHRDVKPANLFVTKTKAGESMIKVLDFGLAKSSQPDGFAAGVVQALGTPRYMSPEQIGCSTDLDGRSDVWSIGVTLYELLTGHPVFDGATSRATFTKILEGMYVPIRNHRPEISPALAAIIDRCIMRDRTARFADVGELARALETMGSAVAVSPAYQSTLVSPSDPLIPVTKPLTSSVSWSRTAPTPMTFGPPLTPSHAPVAMTVPAASPRAQGSGATHSPHEVTQPGRASSPPSSERSEPTLRQTVLAALAGPLLIAIVAGVMAVMVGAGPARAASGAAPGPMPSVKSAATHVTAKAAPATPRAKAVVSQAISPSPKCARHPRSAACLASLRGN